VIYTICDSKVNGIWIAIIAILCFVSSNIIFRKVEHDTSPAYINAVRTFIGVISFTIIALFTGVFHYIFDLPWDLWLWLILSFIFGQVIGDTAFFTAQKKLGTTKALAISMSFPLFTYSFSMLFLGEKFNPIVIIAFLCIFLGVILIKRGQRVDTISPIANEGDQDNSEETPEFKPILYCFIASVAWAIGLVIIDYATKRVDAQLQMNQYSSLIGNLIRFPFAFILLLGVVYKTDGKISLKKSPKSKSWLWLLLASVIGTTLGAHFYTEAVRFVGATRLSLISTASPLFALPLAFLVNNEKITLISFLGTMLTVGGVILIFL
jgi:drug/metabolite transporter (DMT)-like permease